MARWLVARFPGGEMTAYLSKYHAAGAFLKFCVTLSQISLPFSGPKDFGKKLRRRFCERSWITFDLY